MTEQEPKGWNDRRLDLAAALWAEGKSASEIAMAIGGGLSRSAIIGKLHRSGLSDRAKANHHAVNMRYKAPEDRRPPRSRAPKPPRPTAPARQPRIKVVPAPDAPGQYSLVELRTGMCRWPIGDPKDAGFGFCGACCPKEKPYCSTHAERAFDGTAIPAKSLIRSLRRFAA